MNQRCLLISIFTALTRAWGKIPAVLFASLCIAQAAENEIWISPVGTATTSAAGTPNDPYRCPDWSSLSTVLGLSQYNGPTTFHFMTGTFEIQPPGIVPKTGWKLRGAG